MFQGGARDCPAGTALRTPSWVIQTPRTTKIERTATFRNRLLDQRIAGRGKFLYGDYFAGQSFVGGILPPLEIPKPNCLTHT